jgi:two-component system sensor histidine kinase FlrB
MHSLWCNLAERPEINVERYRRRVREKFSLPVRSNEAVARLSRLENTLSCSNAGLRMQLAQLSEALDRSDAQCASETAMREALSDKFSRLMRSLPVGVIELDSQGQVRMANPAAEKILGKPVQGLAWFDVVRDTFKPQADDGFEISTIAGRRVSVQTQSFDDRAGQLILLNDHTDTRKLQERLAQSDRLAALGRTAATLAHQVRTPVCGALLYLSQVLRSVKIPADERQRVEKAVSRLGHLERQVKQILMFAKGGALAFDAVLLGDFVLATKEALASLEAGSDCNIRLVSTVDPSKRLMLNQEALVGSVVNLVENAVLACGDDGEIHVDISLAYTVCEPALNIAVSDNGHGMDAAALENATQPFFTRRADGTGLGLSMVKTVVQAHGGDISLSSVVGEGTVIAVSLPIGGSNACSAHSNSELNFR